MLHMIVIKCLFDYLYQLKNTHQAWGYKTLICSTQLNMKFIMLISVKMPTFINVINTTYERLDLKQETSLFVVI